MREKTKDLTDTIAAISTAQGEGGIGIVRISGTEAGRILAELFVAGNTGHDGKGGKDRGKEKETDENGLFPATGMKERRLTYGKIKDPDTGEHVDEVLAVFMKGPHTYTGEDVCEIDCHGSMVSLRKILSLALDRGARLAEPGEFTKRGFLNGRMDLSQAEAVIDLIKAPTEKTFHVALDQLEGRLGTKVREIRAELLDLLVEITVNIDYPDEDIEELLYRDLTMRLSQIGDKVAAMLDTVDTGRILSQGFRVTIAGRPNVGKSSLMNLLLGENRAIVTDIPGTTRDTIREALDIEGIPVEITDTAGIRATENPVERIGVEKSKKSFNEADLVILVLDGSRELTEEDLDIMEKLDGRQALVLVNKTDLDRVFSDDEIEKYIKDAWVIETSFTLEKGVKELKEAIARKVYGGKVRQREDVTITNLRHKILLEEAHKALTDACAMAQQEQALDFIEVDVNRSYETLGEILGEAVSDDIIEEVFSRFCLGK